VNDFKDNAYKKTLSHKYAKRQKNIYGIKCKVVSWRYDKELCILVSNDFMNYRLENQWFASTVWGVFRSTSPAKNYMEHKIELKIKWIENNGRK
jgi:hypothetical protein